MTQVVGVYELAQPLTISSSCLGKRFRAYIGGRPFTVILPTLEITPGEPPIVKPPLIDHLPSRPGRGFGEGENHVTSGFRWGGAPSWNANTGEPAVLWLQTVALTTSIPSGQVKYMAATRGVGAPAGPRIEGIFDTIDRWFDNLYTWVAVAVGQDTHHAEPLRNSETPGGGLTIRTVLRDGSVSLERSAPWTHVLERSTPSINLTQLRKLVSLNNRGQAPSLARLILHDGHVDLRRGRFRKAVIDAGNAAEVALALWCAQHKQNLPRAKPTLGNYVTHLNQMLPPNAKPDLVDVRNDAIHNGLSPTGVQATVAIGLASQVLDTLEPLPA